MYIKIKLEQLGVLSNDAILMACGKLKNIPERKTKRIKNELIENGFKSVELNGNRFWKHIDDIESLKEEI